MLLDFHGQPVTQDRAPDAGRESLASLTGAAHDVQITRSFSFKLNLGNYESADFFCSQKADCAPADAEEVSLGLYEFCVDEVMKSVKDLKERRAKKEAARAQNQKREAA
jgi:hypothetical protein